MIHTPQNQKVLTNVAVVRLKKQGKRFEIACYPNTVMSWRSGAQKDLTEVLQARTVFTNVSKGIAARNDELTKAFGTTDQDAICNIILEKGELQVGDKERKQMLDTTFRDIAAIVAEKCINPHTSRPLTVSMVEKAMRDDLHYSVVPRKNAKQQALDVIRMLKEKGFPIERAPMYIRVLTADPAAAAGLVEEVRELASKVELPEGSAAIQMTIDPSNFRKLEAAVKGKGRIEITSLSHREQGDTLL